VTNPIERALERADAIIAADHDLDATLAPRVYPAVEQARKRELLTRTNVRYAVVNGSQSLLGIATNLDFDVWMEKNDKLSRSSAILNAVDEVIPDDTKDEDLLKLRREFIAIAARHGKDYR
jgi:hypothetical protein